MLRAGHGLILIVVTLLVIGVVMVNSAGLTVTAEKPLDLSTVLLGRTTGLAIASIVMLLVASRIPVMSLYRLRGGASPIPWIVLGIFALLLAVHLPGLGKQVNGARRWIQFGALGFQPSEIAKWGLIIVIAWYAARRR